MKRSFGLVFLIILLVALTALVGSLVVYDKNYEQALLLQQEQQHQQELLEMQQLEAQRAAEQQQLLEEEVLTQELTTPSREYNENTQFVMISFDGSRSNDTWQQTLDFADELRTEGIGINFTYFISGVYFIPNTQKYLYNLSWLGPASSNISFGDSVEKTNARIAFVNRAYEAGHEIGSHLNGHFDGSAWSAAQWSEEFDFFEKIIFNKFSEKITRAREFSFSLDDIKGIRSPLLSKNNALYQTLADKGSTYDTSKVSPIGTPPWKDVHGIWQFPLVPLSVGGKRSLSMDYNHYELQTDAQDRLTAGTPEWEQAKNDVAEAYRFYFESEYNGNRAPVNIGHHFSMWNDGVYWEALKEFTRETCGQPDVVCTNYSDLVEYLEDIR